jgi:hypothetical protein
MGLAQVAAGPETEVGQIIMNHRITQMSMVGRHQPEALVKNANAYPNEQAAYTSLRESQKSRDVLPHK